MSYDYGSMECFSLGYLTEYSYCSHFLHQNAVAVRRFLGGMGFESQNVISASEFFR